MAEDSPTPPPEQDLDMEQVLVSAAHEMKNSLGLVIERLDRMGERTRAETGGMNSEVNEVRYEISRINSQLVGLLSTWRVRNRQYYLDIQAHTPRDLIDDLLIEYGPLLEAKGIAVQVDCPQDLEWFYDNNLVATALGTAINNAFHYTRSMLGIRVEVDRDGLVVEVLDDGAGFPAEFIPSIPCGGEIGSTSPHGTGLGLCLASLVARAHQDRGRRGRVEVSNRPEGGGSFRMYLP